VVLGCLSYPESFPRERRFSEDAFPEQGLYSSASEVAFHEEAFQNLITKPIAEDFRLDSEELDEIKGPPRMNERAFNFLKCF